MTAKRLMLLSLLMSIVGLSVLLLSQDNKASASNSEIDAERSSKVLVTTRTIEMGQTYSPNMFRWKELPQAELADYIDYITPEDIQSLTLVSGIAGTKLVKGQVLSLSDITAPSGGYSLSLKLQSGFRAISVPVDQVTANSGFIQPGDRVDLVLLASHDGELMRYGNASQGLYVTTITHDARVLAFNNTQSAESFQKERSSIEFESGIPEGSTVSLEVTPEQANQIILAKQLGKITLSLRSQTETSVTNSAVTNGAVTNNTGNNSADNQNGTSPKLAPVHATTLQTISPNSTQVLPDVGLVEFRANKKKINNKSGADNNG